MNTILKCSAIGSLVFLAGCGGGSGNGAPGLITPDEEATRMFSDTSGDIADVIASGGPALVAREVSEATWRETYPDSGTYEIIDGVFSIEADGNDLLVTIGEEGGQTYVYRVVDAASIDSDQITIEGPDGYFDLFISGGGTFSDLFDSDIGSGYARRIGLYFSPDGENFGYETRSIIGTETRDEVIADLAGEDATAVYNGRANISLRRADLGWQGYNANLNGDLEMLADFGAGEVSGSIGNLYLEEREGPDVVYSDDQAGSIILEAAAIQQNAFQGNMSSDAILTAANPDLADFADSGIYSGAFYGPNAEEIAGTMLFDTTVNGFPLLGIGHFQGD